jgi:hypothetical protein
MRGRRGEIRRDGGVERGKNMHEHRIKMGKIYTSY